MTFTLHMAGRWIVSSLTCAAAVFAVGPTGASIPIPPDAIVVTGKPEPIVINGRSTRCRPLRGDPLGTFEAPGDPVRKQSVVQRSDRDGRYVQTADDEPVTGAGFWQLAGTGIDQYVYRRPTKGSLLCIGARQPGPEGYGQLRTIVDATPYRGKRVRFTGWVSSRHARLVRFWLAAGQGTRKLTNGGNTNNQAWGGSHGWTPVMLEIGPISEEANQISYGFLLHGSGDVWMYKPQLEVVTENDGRTGDVAVIGSDK
jgi:hypothetical protein